MNILSVFLILLTVIFPVTATCQQEEFVEEVNAIRGMKGADPLNVSTALLIRTSEHARLIEQNNCNLIRKEDFLVASLTVYRTVARSCRGGICELTPTKWQNQGVKDKAWSFAYRPGCIYAFESTDIAVSFAVCGTKTVLVVLVE